MSQAATPHQLGKIKPSPSEENTTDLGLSVLIPTYRNDDPDHLSDALSSVLNQSRSPDEIVLVEDGPLSQPLRETVDEYRSEYQDLFTVEQLETNQGLASALRAGVKACTHDLIARMDADDVSPPKRFEQQLGFLESHSDVDVVGGYIAEFSDSPTNAHAYREVPTSHETIAQLARWRSPLNHASVIFRRDAVLSAGNYRTVDRMEDWDLWSRMLQDGARMANIPSVLLYARAGPEMYSRRGGVEYGREEIRTQVEFFRRGFTSPPRFLFNLATRVPVRFVPNQVRGAVYRQLFRSNA